MGSKPNGPGDKLGFVRFEVGCEGKLMRYIRREIAIACDLPIRCIQVKNVNENGESWLDVKVPAGYEAKAEKCCTANAGRWEIVRFVVEGRRWSGGYIPKGGLPRLRGGKD